MLCARPSIGAITLALLFGLFNLIAEIWMLAQGNRPAPHREDPALRQAGKAGKEGGLSHV